MKDNLSELNEKITKKRNELDLAIENNKDEKFIYEKSTELDDLILEYLKNNKN